jgi:calreticulin
VDQTTFSGTTPYVVMFGPDICAETKRIHAILADHKGVGVENTRQSYPGTDQMTHMYTFILRPDKTYAILLDREEQGSGYMYDDYPAMLVPKMVPDPLAVKPEDWDEREKIVDGEDKKPSDWVDDAFIPDPDADKPSEWDDEVDGVWEPNQLSNPAYRGEWKPRLIKNFAYKGTWTRPLTQNPEWTEDMEQRVGTWTVTALGLEIWQVKSGTIFDDILLTDSEEEAQQAAQVFLDTRPQERAAHRAFKLKEAEEMRKQEEAEEAMQKATEHDEL